MYILAHDMDLVVGCDLIYIFLCVHILIDLCVVGDRIPLIIAPLSAAGENLRLKPAGVYKYSSGIVREIRDI